MAEEYNLAKRISTPLSALYFLVLALLLVSCGSGADEDCTKFIDQFQDSEFNVLYNKSVFIRGGDGDGNSLLFIIDNDSASGCQSPASIVIASVSYKKQKINYFDYKLTKPYCTLLHNDKILLKIVKTFMSYKVASITVDRYNNVFIGLDTNERKSVAKLAAPERVSNYVKESLVKVRGDWYKRVE